MAAYLWLTFTLRQFPYTRPWSDTLRGRIFALLKDFGSGALEGIPGLFAVVVIFILTRLVVRLVDTFFLAIEKDRVKLSMLEPDTVRATRRITTTLIWIFALTVAYQYIPGSSTDAFRAIGVLVGLMISLGSAGLVNQLMSGLVVTYSRALRPGEFVRAGDLRGVVSEVGLLSTKLVAKGEEITIPNAVLVGTTVTNYSRLGGENGPSHRHVGRHRVQRALAAGARDAPACGRAHAGDPQAPRAVRAAEGAVGLLRGVRGARARRDADQPGTGALEAFHTQIQDTFNEFGVQIMSPAFESQPERDVLVPRAQWFAAPAVPPTDASPAKEAS